MSEKDPGFRSELSPEEPAPEPGHEHDLSLSHLLEADLQDQTRVQGHPENPTFDAVAQTVENEKLEQALGKLSPRDAEVLRRRFGLYDGYSQTLEEIGQALGVTKERVRQIEGKAFMKLKGLDGDLIAPGESEQAELNRDIYRLKYEFRNSEHHYLSKTRWSGTQPISEEEMAVTIPEKTREFVQQQSILPDYEAFIAGASEEPYVLAYRFLQSRGLWAAFLSDYFRK